MILTENEIIKALERMSEEDQNGFSSDILGVINRQKAEIERLQNERIERIRELTRVVYDKEIAEIKSEARKEFWEQIKAMYGLDENDIIVAVNIKEIDDLLAEMESEK